MKPLVIFNALSVVCRGTNATMDPVTLNIGTYALLQNVRVDSGVFKVRNGQTDLSASGLPNGWVVGCLQASMDGTDYVFLAVDTGSAIQVLASTGVSFTEWTRATGGGGSYNTTRFSSGVSPAAYKRVSMVVVKAPTRPDSGILSTTADQDVLVCSDGIKVLVSTVTQASLYPHPRLSPGLDFGKFRQEATFPDFMPISSGLSGTDRSDADVTVSTSATVTTYTGGAAPQISFTTAADTDDYGELQWTTANDICQGPCMAVMYTSNDAALWDKVKLEIAVVTSHALKVIWDPTSTTTTKDRPTVVTIDSTKKVYMAVFPLDPANTPVATTFDRFRLTYKLPASPAAQIDFFLLGWYAGGKIPGAVRDVDGTVTGTTQFEVSQYSSNGFSESEPVKCQDLGGVENTQLGMTDKLNKFQVPVFAECTYSYRVTYQASTEVGNGVDYALVYCRYADPTGYRPDTYYLIAQDQFANYSGGSWSYLSGYSSGGLQTLNVNTSVLLPREGTKPFHRPVMPFKCSVWADGRLLLGGVKKDDSASFFGGLFASRKGDPFDFSEFERFLSDGSLDQTGPVCVPLGGELPQGMATVAGTRSDLDVSSSTVVVTDRGAWAVDTRNAGSLVTPTYLCHYGTKAQASVVSGGGYVWWFDVYGQIRRAGRDVDSPSLWRVEALWIGIPIETTRSGVGNPPQSRPRNQRVCCQYFNDKLYTFYTATAQTYNQACSVYDVQRDLWYDDALGVNCEQAYVWPVAGQRPQLRTVTVGDDTSTFDAPPKVYSHETNTTDDDGTGITINVQTGYLHSGGPDEAWQSYSAGQVGIVADKSTGQTLSVVKTSYPTNATVTGTIDMETDITGNQTVRYELANDSSGNKPHIAAGAAYQVSVQGTYAPGKRIMAIYMRHSARDAGTDVKRS